ncbi:hypothetical protein [Faucicola boevrei]|nr:hypothetical protein [Moraxella boevrei]
MPKIPKPQNDSLVWGFFIVLISVLIMIEKTSENDEFVLNYA